LILLFQRNESESDPLEAAASVSASALGTDAATIDDGSASSDGQSGKKKKNRCFNCKKKVGLTGKAELDFTNILIKNS
jgi:hypothetical protein